MSLSLDAADMESPSPSIQSYNQRALVRCEASYLGAAIPTLTTQPPGIILEPLTVICNGQKLPKVKKTPAKLVRMHVFHSGIIIEILFGRRHGELVWYPIQNLYCSAGLQPQKNKRGTSYVFKTLEESKGGKGNTRPIFAIVMRETVHKKVLQCYAFSVINQEIAKLLVQATAVAFKDKSGWNQPVTIDRFSQSNFTYTLSEVGDLHANTSSLSSNHVSEIEVGGSESESQTADSDNPTGPTDLHGKTATSGSSSSGSKFSARDNHKQMYEKESPNPPSPTKQVHVASSTGTEPTQTLSNHHPAYGMPSEYPVSLLPISSSPQPSSHPQSSSRQSSSHASPNKHSSKRHPYQHTNGYGNPHVVKHISTDIPVHEFQNINLSMNHQLPSRPAERLPPDRTDSSHSYLRQIPPEVLYDFTPPHLYPPGTMPPYPDGMEAAPIYHPEHFMYGSPYTDSPKVIPSFIESDGSQRLMATRLTNAKDMSQGKTASDMGSSSGGYTIQQQIGHISSKKKKSRHVQLL